MCKLTLEGLYQIAPGSRKANNPTAIVAAINMTAERFYINATPRRLRYFVAQMAFETQDFTKFEEDLNYKDPVRIAQIFKSGFDANKNGVADPAEIEFAKGFIRQPQKLANRAYANRFGNGDEASGDGWRYRGSGGMHTTFKANFLKASMALYGDDRLVRNPDALRDTSNYDVIFLSAGQFWKDNACNELADADAWTKLTGVINGSTVTAPDRKPWLARANAAIA
jgi:putative chitinase